ncbi:nucleotidyltransferase family protein [Croceicoccus sp. Ery15]|uniref:nucleotidyltransferase family protein n=1 Tax=Croceicoccus sp. Ery15 TaxID=1703338 RepID=UPI001E3ABFD9|nr:nucleotidyltransferase family protein [Croceicoccus sp. Ery15]
MEESTQAPAASALILAGSRPEPDLLALSQGVSHKALIRIDGHTMLERVHAALVQAGYDRIYVSASDDGVVALAQGLGMIVVPPATGPSGSVARVFELSGAPLLVTTSDHALLRPEWVRDFTHDAPAHCDVAILLAERGEVEKAVPDTKRTWLRFADGDWSGCNLFLLNGAGAARALQLWSSVEADRKRPWRIVGRLGLGTLVSYGLGRLTLADGVRRLGKRNGIAAEVVAARDGEAAVDVDKADDLVLARQLLARRVASV